MSTSGGSGFGGGGGGRISVNVFSRHDDTEYFVHGERMISHWIIPSPCPEVKSFFMIG